MRDLRPHWVPACGRGGVGPCGDQPPENGGGLGGIMNPNCANVKRLAPDDPIFSRPARPPFGRTSAPGARGASIGGRHRTTFRDGPPRYGFGPSRFDARNGTTFSPRRSPSSSTRIARRSATSSGIASSAALTRARVTRSIAASSNAARPSRLPDDCPTSVSTRALSCDPVSRSPAFPWISAETAPPRPDLGSAAARPKARPLSCAQLASGRRKPMTMLCGWPTLAIGPCPPS